MKIVNAFFFVFFSCTANAQFYLQQRLSDDDKKNESEWIQTIKSERVFSGCSINVEEDFFLDFINGGNKVLGLLGDEDRDYTGGFSIQINGKFAQVPLLRSVHKFINNKILKLSVDEAHTFHSFLIGFIGFTPAGSSLNVAAPIYDDRPYGCLVFLSNQLLQVRDPRHVVSSQLSFGVIGLNVMREVQTEIHRIYKHVNNLPDSARPYYPKGWANQISNGGEPTFLYQVAFKKLLSASSINKNAVRWYDVTNTKEANLGYFTGLKFEMTARLGHIHPDWYSFTTDHGMGSHRNFTYGLNNNTNDSTSISRHRALKWQVYTYASARATTVLYNAMLEGQFRKSAVTYNFDQVTHGLLEADLGAVINLYGFSLTALISGRTHEFESPKERNHYWGSVYLAYNRIF